MFSRTLFPVDDGESLPASVQVVAANALRRNAEVRVLHVHQVNQASVN